MSEQGGQSLDSVDVQSDVETVGRLWPGVEKELAEMLMLSQELGRHAWTKDNVTVLTMQDLAMKTGIEDGNLSSTEKALKMLGSKLRVCNRISKRCGSKDSRWDLSDFQLQES